MSIELAEESTFVKDFNIKFRVYTIACTLLRGKRNYVLSNAWPFTRNEDDE